MSVDVRESSIRVEPSTRDKPTGRLHRWLALLRFEEQILLLILLAGVLLCLLLGHGFTVRVFDQYVYLFSGKVGLYFLATRLAFYAGRSWRPVSDRQVRLRRFLFGDRDPAQGLFATDLEFIRGLTVLFVSLTVYTNIKVRIPVINPTVGDPLFQKLDHMIFGTQLFPWLEQAVRESALWTRVLQSIYDHDYMYMVILLFLLHLRRDRQTIRWCFTAVAFTYVLAILMTVAYPTYGPCFVYYGQYEWLRETTRMGQVQEALLQLSRQVVAAARADEPVVAKAFYGIAAFPSLHVGHMSLLVIFAWVRYRIYTPLVFFMTCMTFVATMAFAWHYAVDALGGVALALVVAPAVLRVIVADDRRRAATAEAAEADDRGAPPC